MITTLDIDLDVLYVIPTIVFHNHPGFFMITVNFLIFALVIEFEHD